MDIKNFYHGVTRSFTEYLRETSELRSKHRVSLWLILPFLLFLSCQTTPQISDIVLKNANFLPLDSGALLYIMADVNQMRPILERLPIEELNDSQTRQMLDRTDYLAAAMFPQESGRRFQLAAWGNYPSFLADFALGFNKDWKKMRSQAGGSYWYSSANRFSLALSSRQAFAASSLTGEPFDPFSTEAGVEMPEGFAEFHSGSPFSCWLENPNIAISRIMNDLELSFNVPVKKLFINLLPVQEEKYETTIRLQFDNVSFARAMTAILNTAYNRFRGSTSSIIASIFFANPPVLNGSNVDIKSAALTNSDIESIFSLFF